MIIASSIVIVTATRRGTALCAARSTRLRFSAVTRTRSAARPPAASKPRDALVALSWPGPHPVLRGDLSIIGTPGVVFTPAEGLGLPAVAFGHDWLQPVERYADLLRHLASWGIVAAAPNNHRGVLPSHSDFAADLRTTLEVCAGVRLGEGKISVDARCTAFAGHGIGGGAALVAAAGHPHAAALVTIAVAQTHLSALDAARTITIPTLHIAAGKDTVVPASGHAEPIAAAAGGPVWLRTLTKASHTGFLDGSHWSDFVLTGGPDAKTRRVTRALVTAFLLNQLCDESRTELLVSGDVPGTVLHQRP